MKRMNITKFLRVGGIALATGYFSMFSGVSQAGNIANSVHDFSGNDNYTDGTLFNWNTNLELCTVCHTPHASDTLITAAPLWGHDTTAVNTYVTYDSNTLDAEAGGPLLQPAGVSQLCLSCHDGTVAIDSFGANSGAGVDLITGITADGRSRNIGGDTDTFGNAMSLKNDHPIGFTFDPALAVSDPGLFDPDVKTIDIGLASSFTKNGTISEVMLSGGTVQCTSCHDVHNNYVDETVDVGGYRLLKRRINGSVLCLTCHDK